MQFSLLYFANRDAANAADQYRLLLDTVSYADGAGYEAVWLPERHFHPFGGAFPSPSVAASAVAARTERLRIRAGSVVLPLNDVLRVAEEWAFVDNLSDGRVDLAFATGWNPTDFVLSPDRFADRRSHTMAMAEEVRHLWQGGAVVRRDGEGREVTIRTYPRPIQPDLDVWLTCTASPEGFRQAGSAGYNVLTALLFQPVRVLRKHIDRYRRARAEAGHGAGGRVTLMLHAHLGPSVEEVAVVVKPAFVDYLRSSIDLWRGQWPELERADAATGDRLVEFAFERYFRSAALFGTVESCQPMIAKLAEAGVDEIACLIDFGLDRQQVLSSLAELATLNRANAGVGVR